MSYLTADALIGHGRIRAFLDKAASGKPHHAYLFVGPEHVGKDTIARAFIGSILGRPIENWDELASHPDVAVLTREEEKKNIGVEPMRVFLRHFTSSSLLGGVKIGVIPGAQDLSAEAGNALLKTLEEPPGNALLLLTVNDLARLPETVKSRCQTLRFLPVPVTEIRDGLVRRGTPLVEATTAARVGNGLPGIAVALSEDPAALATHEEQVTSFVHLVGSSTAERLSKVQTLAADATPTSVRALLDVWTGVLRDMVCVKTGNDQHAANAFALASLRTHAGARTLTALGRALAAVRDGKRFVAENVSPRLVLEHISLAL